MEEKPQKKTRKTARKRKTSTKEIVKSAKDSMLPKIVQVDQKTGKVVEVPDSEAYVEPESSNRLSVGVVVPRQTRVGLQYLRKAKEFETTTDEDIKNIIKLCNILYYKEGFIGAAIDLFVDYGQTEVDIEGLPQNSKEKDVCQFWIENVNKDNNNMETGINGLISELLLEYWIAGNVFPYRIYDQIKSTELNSKNVRNKRFDLPLELFLIDPTIIKIPDQILFGGKKDIYIDLEDDFKSIGDFDEFETLKEALPQELKNRIDDDGKLKLPEDQITHIKRRSRSYQTWGVPFLQKAFNAIARKKKLQALDESTIDGIINSIDIFKIGEPGNIDEDRVTWDSRRLRAFASLIAEPNVMNALVWTHDVEHLHVGPDPALLDFDKKYDQVDKVILQSLNIPTSLIAGEGDIAGRAENVWVAVSTIMERIEKARNQIKEYIEFVLLEILEKNGLNTKNKPKIRWKKMNLRNEKEYRDFVIALYDRGILPIETAVKEAGYDWNETIDRRLREHKEKLDGMAYEEVFDRRDMPFSPKNNENPDKGRPEKINEKPKEVETDETTVKSDFTEFSEMLVGEIFSIHRDLKANLKDKEFDPELYIVGRFQNIRMMVDNLIDENNPHLKTIDKKLSDISSSIISSIKNGSMSEIFGQVTKDIFEISNMLY